MAHRYYLSCNLFDRFQEVSLGASNSIQHLDPLVDLHIMLHLFNQMVVRWSSLWFKPIIIHLCYFPFDVLECVCFSLESSVFIDIGSKHSIQFSAHGYSQILNDEGNLPRYIVEVCIHPHLLLFYPLSEGQNITLFVAQEDENLYWYTVSVGSWELMGCSGRGRWGGVVVTVVVLVFARGTYVVTESIAIA